MSPPASLTVAERPLRRSALFGHPPGLAVLFLTQMWAEFSYFGLQATLVYYMTERLGFDQAKSSLVYGVYGAAAFFSPFLGGIVADRWLGRTRSVVLGGVLMAAGHLAMTSDPLLFPALALVAAGNGLFLPTLAVQVGALYADDDPRKAHAFSVYYMGINLGGLLAPLVCGSLGEFFGWHWGFGAAAAGMMIGLGLYLGFRRTLPPEPRPARAAGRAAREPLSAADRRGLKLIAAIVAVVVLFRVAYEQSGNVIALWVRHQTDRRVDLPGMSVEIPATWFQSINPLLIILLTPVLLRLWSVWERRRGGGDLLRRMSLGCAISSLALLVMVAAAVMVRVTGGPVGPLWTIAYFVLLTLGELMVIPVGLSLVSALSPVQLAAMTMGAWYIAKFVGSLLAGVMGAYWGVISPEAFFALGACAVLASAALLQWLSRSARPIHAGQHVRQKPASG